MRKKRGLTRISRILQHTRRIFIRGAIILLYHRVTDLSQDPNNLAVSPENFETHLRYLHNTSTIMSLNELGETLKGGKLPRRAVAITFDDGYIDTFAQALPILRSFNIPATIFIPSGQVGSVCEYWWDNLARIFLATGKLPEHLEILIDGRSFIWSIISPADREQVRSEVYNLIKPLEADKRVQVIAKLESWANLPAEGREEYRTVDLEELRALSADPLITIGAHTITHAALAYQNSLVQREEIFLSRSNLEAILGNPVSTFAYPYGQREDFTLETISLVKEAGYELACTTEHGSLEPNSDLFKLNRFEVHNWGIDEFRRNIASFYAL